MKIKAFFREDAGFVNARFISPPLHIDEVIEFLIDTGASKTVFLDKDVLFLNINYSKVPEYTYKVSGIGGSVKTYVIEDSFLIFTSSTVELRLSLPILVV